MNKTFLIFTILFFTTISSQAALYKGQRVYSRVCMECHMDGETFIATKPQREWAALMQNRGEGLSVLHLKSEKFKIEKKYSKYKKYFLSSKYRKKSKHLKEFLIEYAKDSGNVPACN